MTPVIPITIAQRALEALNKVRDDLSAAIERAKHALEEGRRGDALAILKAASPHETVVATTSDGGSAA